MTPQEIFDKVSVHLLTQNRKAFARDGIGCMYRGEEGTMCAVGILIPDSAYKEIIEGSKVSVLISSWPTVPPFFGDNADLLEVLQECHDHYETEEWPEELEAIARHWGLSTTVMDEYLKNAKGPAPEVAA